MITTTENAPSIHAGIKARQQAMWASGDFAVIGTTLQLVGELLCEGADADGLTVTFQEADADKPHRS